MDMKKAFLKAEKEMSDEINDKPVSINSDIEAMAKENAENFNDFYQSLKEENR